MEYLILKYLHILGAVLMGAGLVGVWLADLRSRQHSDLIRFSEAIRYIAVFYDGVVVPGALILLFSGTWGHVLNSVCEPVLEISLRA